PVETHRVCNRRAFSLSDKAGNMTFTGFDPGTGGDDAPPPASGPGYDPSQVSAFSYDDTTAPDRTVAPPEDPIGTKVSDGTSAGITPPMEDTIGTPVKNAPAVVDDAN